MLGTAGRQGEDGETVIETVIQVAFGLKFYMKI